MPFFLFKGYPVDQWVHLYNPSMVYTNILTTSRDTFLEPPPPQETPTSGLYGEAPPDNI